MVFIIEDCALLISKEEMKDNMEIISHREESGLLN